jgi:hypothetical protein
MKGQSRDAEKERKAKPSSQSQEDWPNCSSTERSSAKMRPLSLKSPNYGHSRAPWSYRDLPYNGLVCRPVTAMTRVRNQLENKNRANEIPGQGAYLYAMTPLHNRLLYGRLKDDLLTTTGQAVDVSEVDPQTASQTRREFAAGIPGPPEGEGMSTGRLYKITWILFDINK